MSSRQKSVEILLVEDSQTDRLIATEALARAKLVNNLHCVEDGVDAIDFLRRRGKFATVPRPDLILLDLNLPRKDGREVLQEIKQDPVLRLIPVVVMTTSKDEQDVLRSYGLQANCYVAKPFDFEAFSAAIQALGTFWFEVVTLPSFSSLYGAAPKKPEPTPQRAAERIRVLVIEDNPSDLLLLRASLEKSRLPRYEVSVATTLEEGVRLALEGGFDVILSDLALGDSSGLSTVQRLVAAAPRIPLLVLTANDDDALGVASVMEGAQDYLQKGPDQIRTLARTLRLTVERNRLEKLLQQSQRLETVGQLAGGIAHDFNNLLTVINGHIGLISESDGLAADGRESLKEISAAVSRAASLTRQLLTFSRQQPIRRLAVDLNAVIGDLHKLLVRLIGEQVRVELQLASHLPSVHADVGMMEQVVMNLAINARDAMETGGKLTIRTEAVSIRADQVNDRRGARPGSFVCLMLADTGMGMGSEVLSHIFEPFYTTKGPGKGTGLGLATVHGIVEQHEGWIEVDSEVGKGSRFSVFLPAQAGSAEPGRPKIEEPAAEGRGECVLIVEDEEILRNVLETTLRRHGYRVLMAATAPEALQIWVEQKAIVDLVVTDIVMPGGMSGVDLMEDLRRDNSGLLHIYVSGYSTEFYRGREQFVEGVNFMQKPYSLSALTRLIRAKIDRKNGRGAA